MSTQVRITLRDEVYRRAKRLAQMSNRNIEELLAQAIELSLSPVGAATDNY
jgi:predicted transcriptional regulator